MKAEFPSSIDPTIKFIDRYTVRDVARGGVLTLIGWFVGQAPGATVGLVLGFILTEFQPGGKTLDTYLLQAASWITTTPIVSSPELRKIVDGTVVLGDDTVTGIVKVSSRNLEYASTAIKKADRDTIAELLNKADYRTEIHSRQHLIDVSDHPGTDGSTVTTHHYVTVKASGQSVSDSHRQVKERCNEIRELLTAGNLYAEHLTGSRLQTAVKRLDTGDIHLSGKTCETERDQKHCQRLLYVDEFPARLPFGWLAQLLNKETPGLVDTVQVVAPVTNHQRSWMDRMLARIKTEISASRTPSRQAQLREQQHDLEDLIDAEAGRETLVNYDIYIVARGDTSDEAEQTLEVVRSVLNRLRVDADEPSQLPRAVRAASVFHTSRFSRSEIVPGHSAATGFSFDTHDSIEPNGVKLGQRSNDTPVILDRFSWDASHITVMGKIGSGKTYWTKLMLLRSAQTYDDLNIYVIDPKKRDYETLVETLDGENVVVDSEPLDKATGDVVRYTVEDPSRDNTEALADTVRHVYRQAVRTDAKTLVVIDEAHRIITRGDRIYEDGLSAVATLIRETRDRNVAATLVSQNADEFTRSNEGRNILKNTDCNVFFKHKKVNTQLTDFFQLSERQTSELRKLRTGNKLPFSEALIQGPVNTRLKIDAQPREHHIIENGQRESSPQTTESLTEHVETPKKRGDGGQKTTKEPDTGSKDHNGFFAWFFRILKNPIGLFEFSLLAGLLLIGVLHSQYTLASITPMLSHATLVDVFAASIPLLIGLEIGWIILLTVDTWLANSRR